MVYNSTVMEKIVGTKPIYRDKRRRAWELDLLRGVAVIAMCFDHMMYDVAYFRYWFSNSYEIMNPFMEKVSALALLYWKSSSSSEPGFRFWGHLVFIFIFLFLVGTSCAFSRDNTRRGALCGIASLAFTGISFVCRAIGVMEDGVVFGILQCISACILCCAALDVLTSFDKKFNTYAPLVLGVTILVIGICKKAWIHPPGFWDLDGFVDEHFLGYIFGTNAYGDDWFGLFPYIGFVLLGMYWGKAAYAERASLLPRLDGKWNKPFTFIGRHALITYFIHQVVIAGIIMVVCMCMGYRM